jgi:hypothetical protein
VRPPKSHRFTAAAAKVVTIFERSCLGVQGQGGRGRGLDTSARGGGFAFTTVDKRFSAP